MNAASLGGWEAAALIIGLALVTVITRSFFFLSTRDFALPGWVQRGLRYAPIAALTAIVVPEVVLTHGELTTTWADARLWGTAAATAWFFWRRGILGTIVVGMAVFMPLRIGLGW
jgi:branched-subunit amino acid transport protein